MTAFLNTIKSVKALISPLSAFFLGTIFTCTAYGLLSSTLSLKLNDMEVSTFEIGMVMALYYAGYIFASLSSHTIINRVGHIRAFGAYISVLSALVLLHAFSANSIYWGILRLLEGYCLGAAIMCLESWLNTRTQNKNRGVIMSLYMITTYLGSAFGQLLLNIPDPNGIFVFITVSVLYSVALVPISLTALPTPDIAEHKSMSIKRLYQISPVGVVGCIVSGVMVGSVYILGTVYASKSGLDLERVSLFMFFIIMGGMLAQLPVGKLSDRMDRRFVLMWEAGILFFIAPWTHLFISGATWELALVAIILGAGVFVMYPLCVSHVNDKIDDSERVEASGMLILLQSIGMIFGPIVISFMMQTWGAISFLISFSVVNGFFVLFSLSHITFKSTDNDGSTTKMTPVPMSPTHVYHKLTQNKSLVEQAKNFLQKTLNEKSDT